MKAECDLCKDGIEKECSVFIYPSHYKPDHSIFCAEHEAAMRQMINEREQTFKILMENSVRAPELEYGLDPIYVCQRCNNNFPSSTPEHFCDRCREVEKKLMAD